MQTYTPKDSFNTVTKVKNRKRKACDDVDSDEDAENVDTSTQMVYYYRKKGTDKKQTFMYSCIEMVEDDTDSFDRNSTAEVECGSVESNIDRDLRNLTCAKNPGHNNFIDMSEFRMDHLPRGYRNREIFDLVKALSDIEVRINLTVGNLKNRGSGWITFSKTLRENPFKAKIKILTAAHLLKGGREVKCMTCFYQFDNVEGRLDLDTFYSVETQQDRLEFICEINDQKVAEMIEVKVKHFKNMHTRAYCMYFYKSTEERRFTFIVSNPHGTRKHVTFGMVTRREVVRPRDSNSEFVYYVYTANTCDASSGGPVYILDVQNIWSLPVHSRGPGINQGISSIQWENITP